MARRWLQDVNLLDRAWRCVAQDIDNWDAEILAKRRFCLSSLPRSPLGAQVVEWSGGLKTANLRCGARYCVRTLDHEHHNRQEHSTATVCCTTITIHVSTKRTSGRQVWGIMAQHLRGGPDKSELATEGVSGWHSRIGSSPSHGTMSIWWASRLGTLLRSS